MNKSNKHGQQIRYRRLIGVFLLMVIGCSRSEPEVTQDNAPKTPLTIWWDKGYVLEEDEAI